MFNALGHGITMGLRDRGTNMKRRSSTLEDIEENDGASLIWCKDEEYIFNDAVQRWGSELRRSGDGDEGRRFNESMSFVKVGSSTIAGW